MKAFRRSYFNGSDDPNRLPSYEWSILQYLVYTPFYSIFFYVPHNHNTSGDKLPFHGQLGTGSHTSRVIKAADKSFFSLNEFVYKSSASAGWDGECVCVCVCDELQCVQEPGFISSCNTLMTLLFHSYPASRRYYHINTCVIKAPQTISWII